MKQQLFSPSHRNTAKSPSPLLFSRRGSVDLDKFSYSSLDSNNGFLGSPIATPQTEEPTKVIREEEMEGLETKNLPSIHSKRASISLARGGASALSFNSLMEDMEDNCSEKESEIIRGNNSSSVISGAVRIRTFSNNKEEDSLKFGKVIIVGDSSSSVSRYSAKSEMLKTILDQSGIEVPTPDKISKAEYEKIEKKVMEELSLVTGTKDLLPSVYKKLKKKKINEKIRSRQVKAEKLSMGLARIDELLRDYEVSQNENNEINILSAEDISELVFKEQADRLGVVNQTKFRIEEVTKDLDQRYSSRFKILKGIMDWIRLHDEDSNILVEDKEELREIEAILNSKEQNLLEPLNDVKNSITESIERLKTIFYEYKTMKISILDVGAEELKNEENRKIFLQKVNEKLKKIEKEIGGTIAGLDGTSFGVQLMKQLIQEKEKTIEHLVEKEKHHIEENKKLLKRYGSSVKLVEGIIERLKSEEIKNAVDIQYILTGKPESVKQETVEDVEKEITKILTDSEEISDSSNDSTITTPTTPIKEIVEVTEVSEVKDIVDKNESENIQNDSIEPTEQKKTLEKKSSGTGLKTIEQQKKQGRESKTPPRKVSNGVDNDKRNRTRGNSILKKKKSDEDVKVGIVVGNLSPPSTPPLDEGTKFLTEIDSNVNSPIIKLDTLQEALKSYNFGEADLEKIYKFEKRFEIEQNTLEQKYLSQIDLVENLHAETEKLKGILVKNDIEYEDSLSDASDFTLRFVEDVQGRLSPNLKPSRPSSGISVHSAHSRRNSVQKRLPPQEETTRKVDIEQKLLSAEKRKWLMEREKAEAELMKLTMEIKRLRSVKSKMSRERDVGTDTQENLREEISEIDSNCDVTSISIFKGNTEEIKSANDFLKEIDEIDDSDELKYIIHIITMENDKLLEQIFLMHKRIRKYVGLISNFTSIKEGVRYTDEDFLNDWVKLNRKIERALLKLNKKKEENSTSPITSPRETPTEKSTNGKNNKVKFGSTREVVREQTNLSIEDTTDEFKARRNPYRLLKSMVGLLLKVYGNVKQFRYRSKTMHNDASSGVSSRRPSFSSTRPPVVNKPKTAPSTVTTNPSNTTTKKLGAPSMLERMLKHQEDTKRKWEEKKKKILEEEFSKGLYTITEEENNLELTTPDFNDRRISSRKSSR
ncbi:hypothetical protein ABK040_014718 [Willaertia magna]